MIATQAQIAMPLFLYPPVLRRSRFAVQSVLSPFAAFIDATLSEVALRVLLHGCDNNLVVAKIILVWTMPTFVMSCTAPLSTWRSVACVPR